MSRFWRKFAMPLKDFGAIYDNEIERTKGLYCYGRCFTWLGIYRRITLVCFAVLLAACSRLYWLSRRTGDTEYRARNGQRSKNQQGCSTGEYAAAWTGIRA